jgi:LysM repeat protein
VAKGETVYSISQKYDVEEREIYRLNPDARNGVQTNSVLILPTSSKGNTEGVTFKTHRVKKRETLFSIAQQYNVSQDELKKYNKELYARQLKTGEKIRIPIAQKTTNPGEKETGPTKGGNFGRHTVLPKETIFGIARKYGISVAELKKLNPGLDQNLPIGTILKVPEQSVVESAAIEDDQFEFYEVQPKEGFFRIKEKFGLTQEQVIELNPYAKEGLKEGMILKIPKEGATVSSDEATAVDLENRISNRSRKHLAIMLPFMLNKVDADSLQNNTELLKRERSIQVALDFYSGVLMAAQFAKDKGIPVTFDVYDTEASSSRVSSLIVQERFDNVDAVIGPLLSANVEKAANSFRNKDILVFSPLSNRDIKIVPNLFQTLPSDENLQNAMIDYLVANASGKNVIVISDASRRAQKDALISKIPNAKTLAPRKEGYLYAGDITAKINTDTPNWVVLESTNPVLVSNVVGLLNGMPSSYNLRLFTLDKGKVYDYDDISNMHLANLNFTFPSVNRTYDYNEKNPFLISYKNKYGVLPNKYAVRGFDLTYDVLLRLAYSENGLSDTASSYETEYLENKFRYGKEPFSGYENTALYILKYNENLQFEVVE